MGSYEILGHREKTPGFIFRLGALRHFRPSLQGTGYWMIPCNVPFFLLPNSDLRSFSPLNLVSFGYEKEPYHRFALVLEIPAEQNTNQPYQSSSSSLALPAM